MTYAPELPAVIMSDILDLCAGEVATLCAVACVSRAWHDAAMQPRRWQKLRNFQNLARPLTDARLATREKRVSGSDGKSGYVLDVLDVCSCARVSARGVVAALRGARLEGRERTLRVEGVRSDADDAAVVPLLRTFLCSPKEDSLAGFLDVRTHLLCNAVVGNEGAWRQCSRLCKSVLCEQCDVVRCRRCHVPSWSHNFRGTLPCEHICADCGYCKEHLLSCDGCQEGGEDSDAEHLICADCACYCENCSKHYCLKTCINTKVVLCASCGNCFCDECAFKDDAEALVGMCRGRCADCYCHECIADSLKTAHEWAATLRLREGEAAVDERVIERLNASTISSDTEDEEGDKRICEDCAMEYSGSMDEDDDPDDDSEGSRSGEDVHR